MREMKSPQNRPAEPSIFLNNLPRDQVFVGSKMATVVVPVGVNRIAAFQVPKEDVRPSYSFKRNPETGEVEKSGPKEGYCNVRLAGDKQSDGTLAVYTHIYEDGKSDAGRLSPEFLAGEIKAFQEQCRNNAKSLGTSYAALRKDAAAAYQSIEDAGKTAQVAQHFGFTVTRDDALRNAVTREMYIVNHQFSPQSEKNKPFERRPDVCFKGVSPREIMPVGNDRNQMLIPVDKDTVYGIEIGAKNMHYASGAESKHTVLTRAGRVYDNPMNVVLSDRDYPVSIYRADGSVEAGNANAVDLYGKYQEFLQARERHAEACGMSVRNVMSISSRLAMTEDGMDASFSTTIPERRSPAAMQASDMLRAMRHEFSMVKQVPGFDLAEPELDDVGITL